MTHIFIKFLNEQNQFFLLSWHLAQKVFFLLQKEPSRPWLEQVKEMVSPSMRSVEERVHGLSVDIDFWVYT